VADNDTNPFNWSLAGGVGGRGLIPGREKDVFGVGYFYNGLEQGGVVDRTLDIRDGEQGFEVFYEAQLTPWLRLTPDVQVVRPGFGDNDTAVVLGLRLLLDLSPCGRPRCGVSFRRWRAPRLPAGRSGGAFSLP
jgi:porin